MKEPKMDDLLKTIEKHKEKLPVTWENIQYHVQNFDLPISPNFENILFPEKTLIMVYPPRTIKIAGETVNAEGFILGSYGYRTTREVLDKLWNYAQIISEYTERPARLAFVEFNPYKKEISIRGEVMKDTEGYFRSGYYIKKIQRKGHDGINYLKDIREAVPFSITSGVLLSEEGRAHVQYVYEEGFEHKVPDPPIYPDLIRFMVVMHMVGMIEVPWIPVVCRSVRLYDLMPGKPEIPQRELEILSVLV